MLHSWIIHFPVRIPSRYLIRNIRICWQSTCLPGHDHDHEFYQALDNALLLLYSVAWTAIRKGSTPPAGTPGICTKTHELKIKPMSRVFYIRITLNNGHEQIVFTLNIKKFLKNFFMSVPHLRASPRHGRGWKVFYNFLAIFLHLKQPRRHSSGRRVSSQLKKDEPCLLRSANQKYQKNQRDSS